MIRLKGYEGVKGTDSGSIPGALGGEHYVQGTCDSVSRGDGRGEEDLKWACLRCGVGERTVRCCSEEEGRKQLFLVLCKPET